MILIINASILRKGGVVQVALSFIQECSSFNENEYHVFMSPIIASQINEKEYPGNFHFYTIRNTPSSLLHAIGSINQLKKLEGEIKPDCVFSVFGPSYWTPKSPHLLGFALCKYIYPESPFFNRIGLILKLKINFLKILHSYFFKKNADYFYVETEDAKQRLSHLLRISEDNIYAFSNTHHSVFNLKTNGRIILPQKNKNEIRLVTISSYYLHKNLEIITKVIPLLKQKCSIKFLFILTIDNNIFLSKFHGFESSIVNLGPIPLYSCPGVYEESDFLFLPTLIEVFTATYPEAMKMKKPILTSDLSFAHDICGEAALYFDPLDPEDIADKIILLANNKDLQMKLVQKGEERLQYFETAESRARKLLQICDKISKT